MSRRKWTDDQLKEATAESRSYRMVLQKLGLIPAGGNYEHVRRRMRELALSTEHFTGKGWNVGLHFNPKPAVALELLLVEGSDVQSFKLKARLFTQGIKTPQCEMCGWATQTSDGRIPVELDHINGNPHDNRLENLRVLCPNCHSLQPTHRGRNKNRKNKAPLLG